MVPDVSAVGKSDVVLSLKHRMTKSTCKYNQLQEPIDFVKFCQSDVVPPFAIIVIYEYDRKTE